MPPYRSFAPLPIAVMVIVVVGVLTGLLFGYAGDRSGSVTLPAAGEVASLRFFLENEERQSTLADVEQLPESNWKPWPETGYVATRKGTVIWARVSLRNPTDEPLHGVLENDDFFADRIDVWLRGRADGQQKHLVSGEAVSADDKALTGRELAWPVIVPARATQVVYLRFQDASSPYARLVWWPDSTDFHEARTRSATAEGIYLGGLLALLAYTTLLWLRLRSRDIGFYVLYLGASAAFMVLARAQLSALGVTLGSPAMENALIVVVGLSAVFLTQFARAFLEVKARHPRFDRCMQVWSLVMLVLAAGPLLTQGFPAIRWMRPMAIGLAITHISLLVLALETWREGLRQGKFFVISFGCLFAGSLPLVVVWFWDALLRDAGMRGLMIGSSLEMLLLALALADRFVRTQRQLTEETEQRRMIEAAYADELAEEVHERTRELQAANADKDRMLAVIGHDLRSPLTGLMRLADATPGDFARDAARTGRTLLLMIEDLVQWARLRAGTRLDAVHQASALVVPAAAQHRAVAEHGGVKLILNVPDDLFIETDLILAQTLLRNLLANALKFARTEVELRAEDDGQGGVRVTVGNDGPALSPEVAARFAADENEPITAEGGMGLRLCREICHALQFRLVARPRVHGGTEFEFTLKKAINPNGAPSSSQARESDCATI